MFGTVEVTAPGPEIVQLITPLFTFDKTLDGGSSASGLYAELS